jgi:hypothetical protein
VVQDGDQKTHRHNHMGNGHSIEADARDFEGKIQRFLEFTGVFMLSFVNIFFGRG